MLPGFLVCFAVCSKLDTPFRLLSRRFEPSEPPSTAAGISELLQLICECVSLDGLGVNQQHPAPGATGVVHLD